jgi:hypothetical protein
MTDFPTLETSRKDGSPVALFYFKYGSDAASYFAYTDAESIINATGYIGGTSVNYEPVPITHGNIVSGGTLDRTALELRMPRTIPLAALFEIWPPSQVVTCVIRHGHLGETGGLYPACWSGHVVSLLFEGSQAVITMEPVITSLRRTGLRRNYQYGCPHALYGNQCKADKVVATISVTVTTTAVDTIIMPAAWFGALNPNKYVGGMVQWTSVTNNTEIRTIMQIVSGKDLRVNGFANKLPDGTAISVTLGCNHQAGFADLIGDCNNLHNNINNFGGQPWIPLINPVSGVLLYH